MPEPPRHFQHYEVLRRDDGTAWELGRGAMGVTYKAFDVNLCCEVALKVVSSTLVEHPEARERFVREARAAAALRHRNVASVYHLGNDGEHFFYAMEFINGETLDALVRRGGPLSVENALRVVLQVSRALAAAARQNLVHRDIKPTNLMATHEDADEEAVVKVIDFGLARPAANADNAPPLTIGGFVGTPQYASPEQLEERPLDARSDFYSLGVTTWFLLTGRVPFTGSLASICQQQLTQPPPWEQLSADVPTCVRGLLGHMLAKDAARRPQNAGELRSEIETCLEKVEGAERQRHLHLGALPAAAQAGVRKPDAAARMPQVGTLLGRRYRLLRALGGNHGVRVHQARDESAGDRPVVVKILPPEFALDPAAKARLAEEVRLAQAAVHPNLVPVLALEQSGTPPLVFLVEEWLAGFSLRDLLAGRGGALSVEETLRLLAPAAAAADHATRCRLGPPPLELTDLHVCFQSLTDAADEGATTRQWLPKPMDAWPDWTLKVHAVRVQADPLALATWAGGDTLLPAVRPGGPLAGAVGESVKALAQMVYELLGGTPSRPALLPALNEEGNRVLRQALSSQSPWVHGAELHEALARAVGEEPAHGLVQRSGVQAVERPQPAAVPFAGDDELPSAWREPVPESAATSYGLTTARSLPLADDGGSESVAGFFQDHPAPELSSPSEAAAGSAWDRLTLVTGERAHPGRWIAGIVGLAAVFVLGFVGVLAWLLQQSPAHALVSPSPTRKHPVEPAASRTVKRAPIPSPLAVTPAVPMPQTAAVSHLEPAPQPTATAESTPSFVAQVGNAFPTPSVGAVAPESEQFAIVRLDSIPEGAQVRVGEEVLGTTPCRVRLPAGTHQLIAHYQNWPVIGETLHLDGTETRAAVEFHLMPPEYMNSLVPASPTALNNHSRRITSPAARRSPPPENPSSATATPLPSVAASKPRPPEPEVRPALRVLTPFKIDDPADAPAATRSEPKTKQPFTGDEPED